MMTLSQSTMRVLKRYEASMSSHQYGRPQWYTAEKTRASLSCTAISEAATQRKRLMRRFRRPW